MLGDLSPILVFAFVGGAMHDGGFSLLDVLRNIGLLSAGWVAAAVVFRPYAHPGVLRLGATWAVGISVGVLLRAAALGRTVDGEYLGFWAVALALTLIVLVAWRWIARAFMTSLDATTSS
jgi:hypothetical protein